jgi:hypothetical protein
VGVAFRHRCAVRHSRILNRPGIASDKPDVWNGRHNQHTFEHIDLGLLFPGIDVLTRAGNPRFGDAEMVMRTLTRIWLVTLCQTAKAARADRPFETSILCSVGHNLYRILYGADVSLRRIALLLSRIFCSGRKLKRGC